MTSTIVSYVKSKTYLFFCGQLSSSVLFEGVRRKLSQSYVAPLLVDLSYSFTNPNVAKSEVIKMTTVVSQKKEIFIYELILER